MTSQEELKFKRILFKVSGEALMGNKEFGHDQDAVKSIVLQIKKSKKNPSFQKDVKLPGIEPSFQACRQV